MKDSTIYIKLVFPSAEKIFVLMKNQYNELNLGIKLVLSSHKEIEFLPQTLNL